MSRGSCTTLGAAGGSTCRGTGLIVDHAGERSAPAPPSMQAWCILE
jgi:hypothetical protein